MLSFRVRYIRIRELIDAVMEVFGWPIIITMAETFWVCFSDLYEVITGRLSLASNICNGLFLASALIRFITLVESSHYLLSAVSSDSILKRHCRLNETHKFQLGL